MIEAIALSKRYGSFSALENISFSVAKGEIIGLLGPNGAGKTTTMRILTGYLSHDEGSVQVAGIDPEKDPLAAKKIIGYLPENPLLYEEFTVEEFLNFIAALKQVANPSQEVLAIMEKTNIIPRRNQLIQSLSRGFKQRVGLASALIGNPDVLILDEPTSGLDPNQVLEIRSLIKEMGKEKTIILSTHILPEVEEICNKVILIDKGKIKAIDTVDGLKAMFQGNPMIIVKSEDPAKVSLVLKTLSFFKSFEVREDKVEIFIDKIENRKELLKALIECDLFEFYAPEVSLEDVFHQLTVSEEGVR
jgi:ABC-2 type transport system ATP-binding protein